MALPAGYVNMAALLAGVGFNNHAQAVLTDAARENLNLDTLMTWGDDEVDDVIRGLRKTMKPANRYVYVSIRAIDNLKTACCFLKHMGRCQQNPNTVWLNDTTLVTWKHSGWRKQSIMIQMTIRNFSRQMMHLSSHSLKIPGRTSSIHWDWQTPISIRHPSDRESTSRT
jgi:hypothetical protein